MGSRPMPPKTVVAAQIARDLVAQGRRPGQLHLSAAVAKVLRRR